MELKRRKDPLYKEIQRYIEGKKAMENLREKRRNTKKKCEELLIKMEHSDMTDTEMKNAKI